MAKRIIIANWKMNPRTQQEAEKLFSTVAKSVSRVKKTEVVICAPFIYLEELSEIRTSKVTLGAQDAYPGDIGAFTGEVSAEMLYGMKVRYAILGHSERRSPPAGGGETNELINKKIKGALASGLRPILCVGESERDENHGYFNLVKVQLEECLSGISRNSISKIIIAYEPIWAISTTLNRRDATPEDSREMVVFIRKVLSDKFGSDGAKVKILYGGSVNEKDAEGFLSAGGVDGLLAGKASLDAKKFSNIVLTAENLK
jgi:triosephosphate isomerase